MHNRMDEAVEAALNAKGPRGPMVRSYLPTGVEAKLIVRAALEAAQPFLSGNGTEAVAIKPLEWHAGGISNLSPVGRYVIELRETGVWWSLGGVRNVIRYENTADAQAAAQADYEARIRSALHPTQPPAAEPVGLDDDIELEEAKARLSDISPPAEPVGALPLTIIYTNWRGETAERQIIPLKPWFGATEWHPEPQWLIKAWDVEKNAERDFAWAGIDFQGNGPALTPSQADTPVGSTLAAPAEGADETIWHLLPELPSIRNGTERYFIIAVRRAKSGKTHSFPAKYLNGYPLIHEDGDCSGVAGKSCPDDDSHQHGCPTSGWFYESSEGEYDQNYSAIYLEPGDELLAWTDIPRFDRALNSKDGA